MTYIAEALAATVMLTAALIFSAAVSSHRTSGKRITFAAGVGLLLSMAAACCYMCETRLSYLLAFILLLLRYFFIIIAAFGRFKWRYLYAMLLYEFAVDIIVSCISGILNNIPLGMTQLIAPIITAVVNLALLAALICFGRRISAAVESVSPFIPQHIYVLVLLAVMCLCGLATLNGYPTESLTGKSVIMNLIIIAFTVTTACIIISLLVNVVAKQRYISTADMLKKQVEIQIRHYDKLERLDMEISAFRHDYINHLHSIHSLIEMNESESALQYIEKLYKTKHKTCLVFSTGNKLADAILTDKADMLPQGSRIDYNGIIPPQLDNIDICTILTNALDNAIEACREFTQPCVITVSALERQGYFLLIITNPTQSPDFESIPATTKSDAQRHGIGLTNIRNTVNKYNGQMNVICKNGIFELSLTMKL